MNIFSNYILKFGLDNDEGSDINFRPWTGKIKNRI